MIRTIPYYHTRARGVKRPHTFAVRKKCVVQMRRHRLLVVSYFQTCALVSRTCRPYSSNSLQSIQRNAQNCLPHDTAYERFLSDSSFCSDPRRQNFLFKTNCLFITRWGLVLTEVFLSDRRMVKEEGGHLTSCAHQKYNNTTFTKHTYEDANLKLFLLALYRDGLAKDPIDKHFRRCFSFYLSLRCW